MAGMSMAPLFSTRRIAPLLWAAAGLLGGVAAAQTPVAAAPDGAVLATQMGCLNCHGAVPRGDSPAFQALRERAARREGDPAQRADHWLREMRESGQGRHAIVTHRQVSDASARALMTWLASRPTQAVN
jgi:cytochrome c551/c552